MRHTLPIFLLLALTPQCFAQAQQAGSPGFAPDRYASRPTVASVEANTTASAIGLKKGDVIVKANGTPIATLQDLVGVFRSRKWMAGDAFSYTVLRGEEEILLKGKWLPPTPKTVLNQKAKPWKIEKWGNVPEGKADPKLESLKGKVIVLLTFQST